MGVVRGREERRYKDRGIDVCILFFIGEGYVGRRFGDGRCDGGKG